MIDSLEVSRHGYRGLKWRIQCIAVEVLVCSGLVHPHGFVSLADETCVYNYRWRGLSSSRVGAIGLKCSFEVTIVPVLVALRTFWFCFCLPCSVLSRNFFPGKAVLMCSLDSGEVRCPSDFEGNDVQVVRVSPNTEVNSETQAPYGLVICQ